MELTGAEALAIIEDAKRIAEDFTRTYSGVAGKCTCGCAGVHRTEVKPSSIRQMLTRFAKNVKDGASIIIVRNGPHVDWVACTFGGRLNVVMTH